MAKTRKCPKCGSTMEIKSEDWAGREWICPECRFFDDDIMLSGCVIMLACILGFFGIIIGIAAFLKYHLTVYQAGVFVTAVFVVIPFGIAVLAKWSEIEEKHKSEKKDKEESS